MKKLLLVIFLFCSTATYAAVGGESLINVQDTTAPTGVVQADRVKDAGTLSNDAITSGIIANGGLLFNGTNWDRMPGDKTNGAYVNIKNSITLTIAGSHTPADSYANPTDAVNSFSLNGIWNGTTWDRMPGDKTNGAYVNIRNSATLTVSGNHTPADSYGNPTDAVDSFSLLAVWDAPSGTWYRLPALTPGDSILNPTKIAPVSSYGLIWNASGSWSRLQSGVIVGDALSDTSSNGAANITTNTTTVVKSSAGILKIMIINAAGASDTVAFYDVASASCTGTPGSGYMFTLSTSLAASTILSINHSFLNGICAVTAGTTAGNISVLYR